MKQLRSRLLTAVGAVLFSALLYGAPATNEPPKKTALTQSSGEPASPQTVAPAVSSNVPSLETDARTQIAVLKQEVQLLREFHQHIIAVVCWSLSTVVALVLALLIFSWWNNSTQFDRERRLIRKELLVQVRSQIDHFKAGYEDRLKAVEIAVQTRTSSLTLRAIDSLRIEAETNKAYTLAFSYAVRQLEDALDQRHEGYMKRALDSILEYLGKDKHARPPKADIAKAEALLAQVPDTAKQLRDEVAGALRVAKPSDE